MATMKKTIIRSGLSGIILEWTLAQKMEVETMSLQQFASLTERFEQMKNLIRSGSNTKRRRRDLQATCRLKRLVSNRSDWPIQLLHFFSEDNSSD